MIVAAAYMGVDDQISRCLLHDPIVQGEKQLLVRFQSVAFTAGQGHSQLRVHHAAPYTVIKLQVSAACGINLLYKFSVSFYHILRKSLFGSVNVQCGAKKLCTGEIRVKLPRGRDGLFCHGIIILQRLHKFEMLHKRMIFHRNLSHHVCIVNHGSLCVKGGVSFHRFPVLHALEAPHKIQMPGGSAELTVCDHMIA